MNELDLNARDFTGIATPSDAVASLLSENSDGTRRVYRDAIADWFRWAGHEVAAMPLGLEDVPLNFWSLVSRKHIAGYKRHLQDSGLSTSTVNVRLAALRSLIRVSAQMRVVDPRKAGTLLGVQGIPKRGTRVGVWISREEAAQLLSAPDTTTKRGVRDKAILVLLTVCMMRRSEVANLHVCDVSVVDGNPVLLDISGKGNRLRTIKLPPNAHRILRAWLELSGRQSSTTRPVFVRIYKNDRVPDPARERPLTGAAIYNIVQRYATTIGLDIGAHDLRRTGARLARKNGAPIEAIQETLGHQSISTTQIYLGGYGDLDHAAPDFIHLDL